MFPHLPSRAAAAVSSFVDQVMVGDAELNALFPDGMLLSSLLFQFASFSKMLYSSLLYPPGLTSKAFRSGPSATICIKEGSYFAKCRTGHSQDVSNISSYLQQNVHHLVIGGLALADYPNAWGPCHTPTLATLSSSISHEQKAPFQQLQHDFFDTPYTCELQTHNPRLADAIFASFLR